MVAIIVVYDPCADTHFQVAIRRGRDTQGWIFFDFRKISDGNRRLSQKQCEIGRWLLWNVNSKSWVPE